MSTKACAERVIQGLTEAQRQACLAIDGPVRIVAGAGTGKTRTITRRIAYACAAGAWDPRRTLAVTFSVRAAGEMRTRLHQLGVPEGVRAATFHSMALRQLRGAWPELTDAPFPSLLRQPRMLAVAAIKRATAVGDIDPLTVRDVLAEIGWAKVSLVAPEDYAKVCAATHRQPPAQLDPARMADVMRAFEAEKTARNLIDFNDILLMTCHVLDAYGDLAAAIRRRIGWLTVDEYQDVSPLQHLLMRRWLSGSRQVCVVGDPAQTIYSFAGATRYYLLHFPKEYEPLGDDVEIATDFRSTPQVVSYANHVLAASPQRQDYIRLRPARGGGSRVSTTAYRSDAEEAQGVARRIERLVRAGAYPGDCAVLTRINGQQAVICAALHRAGLRYRVREENDATEVMRQEATPRTAVDDADRGTVTVSTIHAAKGQEFPHVFIIGCSEGLIPFASPLPGEALEEERRLFYVGVTRAMDTLHLSFAGSKDGFGNATRRPSRFIIRG